MVDNVADLVLGIDGGGSKTRALVGDRDGRLIASGMAGTSNYQVVGFAAAKASLQAAIGDALRSAGFDPAMQVAAACFGLAGVGRPADRELFERWLDEQHFARRHTIVNDAELVLAAGTRELWGVALICGTGSICYGRSPRGDTSRAGGWGYLLGDEGSGYAIALDALRLGTQTADGRASADAVLEAVLRHWNLDEPAQLVAYIYRPQVSRAELATLAGPVLDMAAAGDRHALAIVDAASRELARLVEAVARRLNLERPPLALGGGLLGASARLREGLAQHVGLPLGPITYVDDPAVGGLVLARHLLAEGR